MSDELRPAIVVVKKRGQRTRYMVFVDHNDGLGVAKAFEGAGWRCVIIAVDVYQQGELPPDVEPLE